MTQQYGPENINVRGLIIGLIAASVAATLALIGVLSFLGMTIIAIRWYLLALGAFAVIALYHVIARTYPRRRRSAFDRALEPVTVEHERPERLQALERQVYLAHIDSSEFYYRLAPLLRDIASYRLTSRRNVPAERVPAAARALLGAQIYELLWTVEDTSIDRRGPGIDMGELQAILQAVEEL